MEPDSRQLSTVTGTALVVVFGLLAVLVALTGPPAVGLVLGLALIVVGFLARRDAVSWVLPATLWMFGAACAGMAAFAL